MIEQLIINKQPFPLPNPNIRLFLVTYLSTGLKVKGLLAEPKEAGVYEGFPTYAEESKMSESFEQLELHNLPLKALSCLHLIIVETEGAKGMKI